MIMILSQVNLNSFLVLRMVVLSHSMTSAAKKLGMTQSGVSQHISGLEADLGAELFIREKKKLIPTKFCQELTSLLDEYYHKLEGLLIEVSQSEAMLKGEIVIGAPIEFGNNILLPKLSTFHQKYPAVKFKLKFGLAYEMEQHLREGKIDFAFTDGFVAAKDVQSIKVYQEQLLLCCSKTYFENNKKSFQKIKSEYKNFEYIAYFEEGFILKKWFKEGLALNVKEFPIIATTEDAQGVLAFIQSSMGLGVIPKHMTLNRDDLKIFTPEKKPVLNDISLSFYEKRIEATLLQSFFQYILTSFNLSSSLS